MSIIDEPLMIVTHKKNKITLLGYTKISDHNKIPSKSVAIRPQLLLFIMLYPILEKLDDNKYGHHCYSQDSWGRGGGGSYRFLE